MKIKRVKNDKAITAQQLKVGQTVLYKNSLCMVVSRNGHPFLLNLETGVEAGAKETSEVVLVECELMYKVV